MISIGQIDTEHMDNAFILVVRKLIHLDELRAFLAEKRCKLYLQTCLKMLLILLLSERSHLFLTLTIKKLFYFRKKLFYFRTLSKLTCINFSSLPKQAVHSGFQDNRLTLLSQY